MTNFEQATMSRRCLLTAVILGSVFWGLVLGAALIAGLSKAAHDAVNTTPESAASATEGRGS